jgi:hypothetical protein
VLGGTFILLFPHLRTFDAANKLKSDAVSLHSTTDTQASNRIAASARELRHNDPHHAPFVIANRSLHNGQPLGHAQAPTAKIQFFAPDVTQIQTLLRTERNIQTQKMHSTAARSGTQPIPFLPAL